MYICLCNAITDKQIREAAESGISDLSGLQGELGVAVACGACKESACNILRQSRESHSRIEPILYQPSVA